MKSEPSRTFIGSVVCVDLVGYSLRANADQTMVKAGFNRLLVQVLQEVPPPSASSSTPATARR